MFILLLLMNILLSTTYKVTSVDGDVYLKNKKITKNQVLSLSDMIKIKKNSSLSINDNVKFDNVGVYSVSKIIVMNSLKNSDVNSHLANKLLSDLQDSDDLLSSGGNSYTLGAVERSTMGNRGKISYPYSTYFVGNEILLTWKSDEPVTMDITDEVGNVIQQVYCNSNSITVNTTDFEYNRCYFWSISNNSNLYCLNKVKSIPTTNISDPIGLAMFYKENKFIVEYKSILDTLPVEIVKIIEPKN